jgi:hypothetical protein
MTQTAVATADRQYGALQKMIDVANTPEAKQRLMFKVAMYRADINKAQAQFEQMSKAMKPAEAQTVMKGALQKWIDAGDGELKKAVAQGVFGHMSNVGKPPAGEHGTPVAGRITGKDDGGVPRIGAKHQSVKGNMSRSETTGGKGTVDPVERAEHERGPEEDEILAPDSEDFDYEGVEDGETETVGHPGDDEGEDEGDMRRKKARAKLAAGAGKIKVGQAFGGKVGQKEPMPAKKVTLAVELVKIAPDAMIDVLTKLAPADKVAMLTKAERYAADLMAFIDGAREAGLSKRDISRSVSEWMRGGDVLTKKFTAEALAGAGQIPLQLGNMVLAWEGRSAGRGPFG